MAASMPALALPKMEINQAKGTLYKRQRTPTAVEFNSRRIRDLPSFDKLGTGNYFAEYRLDGGKKLMVWMYVESEPPLVDEVVLYIAPARTSDVTFERAMQLLELVYAESTAGSRVITDFQNAKKNTTQNKYKLQTQTYEHDYLIPLSFDGSLYYLGSSYGYKVDYRKGGLQVVIHPKDYLEKLIMETKERRFPDPLPAPTPFPTPRPTPTPHPKISW